MDSVKALLRLQKRRREAERVRKTTMSRLCRIVVERFRELGCHLPETDYFIRRTKAGRHQLSEGAWRWFLDSHGDIQAKVIAARHGSGIRATEIAKNPQKFILYRGPGGTELL